LLKEIRRGNPEAEITIVIATGLHRPSTEEEQRRMFGNEIVDNERIVVNNAFAPEDFVDMGALPSGAAFHVNRAVVECDLLITEGLIEPHFFAGFSGGCKSVLPGVCSAATVNENHSYKALANPKATTGVIHGNPVHEDMVRAAQLVKVGFILNVVLNEEKKVVAAFAGDVNKAHEQGIEFLKGYSLCEAVQGDIVITSNGGYPLDQNLYQAPKSAATAQCCAGDDGVIILCAGCADGMGGENFKKYLSSGTIDEIDALLRTYKPSETPSETWCVQILCRILAHHKMILVSSLDPELVKKCNMIPASDLDEAMEKAYAIKGRDAKVVVIPDGVAALIIKEE
ncbi:MAG: nickel-dependent lactate racemase, partial [Oscillospiraceae bacterium]|nr:nickel-dependent lactate racemase [Oscillospiraceae bacterium]